MKRGRPTGRPLKFKLLKVVSSLALCWIDCIVIAVKARVAPSNVVGGHGQSNAAEGRRISSRSFLYDDRYSEVVQR